MNIDIKVSPKKAYGREMFQPENETAKLLCELVGQANLTFEQLQTAKKLGFKIIPVSQLEGLAD